MEDAERIHKEAIIIDGHCDTILTVMGRGFMGQKPRDFFTRGETGMIDLPKLKEGGVTCQVMAAYIADQYKPTRSARRALELLDGLHDLVAGYDELRLDTKHLTLRRPNLPAGVVPSEHRGRGSGGRQPRVVARLLQAGS